MVARKRLKLSLPAHAVPTHSDPSNWSVTEARAISKIKPSEETKRRIHDLLKRNQNDELSTSEKMELNDLIQSGLFFDLMIARAKLRLAAAAKRATS